MLDVIGADETLRDVYHLDLTVADVDRSLSCSPSRGCGSSRTSSSACTTAVSWASTGPLRWSPATRSRRSSWWCSYPSPARRWRTCRHLPAIRWPEFFAAARLAAPSTTINLGCARPLGALKRELDEAAIDLGLNGIAYPAEGAIEYARSSRADAAAVRVLLLADLERGTGGRRRPGAGAEVSEAWRLLADDGAGAAEGLALDEALMAGYARDEPERPPTLRLYSYRDHCALVGRYQNLAGRGRPGGLPPYRHRGQPPAHGRRRDRHGIGPAGNRLRGPGRHRPAPPGDSSRSSRPRCARGLALAGHHCEFSVARTTSRSAAARSRASGSMSIRPERCSSTRACSADLDVDVHASGTADTGGETGRPGWRGGDASDSRPSRPRPVSATTPTTIRPAIADGFAKTFGVTLELATPDRQERAHAAALAAGRYRSQSWLGERQHRAGRQRLGATEDAGGACQDLPRHPW